MKGKKSEIRLTLPEGVVAALEEKRVVLSGPRGSLSRLVAEPDLKLELTEGGRVILLRHRLTNKRGRRVLGSTAAHIRNMAKGVSKGFAYRLKICSGHFPMSVAIEGKQVVVRNFLGEKAPRRVVIKGDVVLRLEKDEIVVEGIDKEAVGQAALDIEQLTRVRARDRRIFQDGIYIVQRGDG